MPDTQIISYSKSARTGRPRFKRRRPGTKKLTTKTLAKKIDRVARRVQKMPEKKYVDVAGQFNNMDDAAETAVLLNGALQGDDVNERMGREINGKYLTVRGTLFRNAAANQLSDLCRIVVVQDLRQRSDTAPAFTDIFANASWQAHMNWDNRGRFRILYDKLFEIDANNPSQTFKAVIPYRHKVKYNGIQSTDIESNGIYIVGIGSDATAGGDGPTFYYNTRFVYTDA